MKTSDKIWIFIGFLLLSVIVGYIIYDIIHPQKITPEVYHIKCQFDTKDDIPVSLDCGYFAVFGDDPYKDDPYKNKEMCIKLLSSEVIHEIFCDLCLADCLQKRDELLYDIRQNLTTKVLQKFPDTEFQVIDIVINIKLNSCID